MSLNDTDQQNMLNLLQITREQAFEKYWRTSGNIVQMKTVDGHCIFYSDGCTVHRARPWRCREWPLVRAILKAEENLETIKSSCPGMNKSFSYSEVCQEIEKGGCLEDTDRSQGLSKNET